MLTGQRIFETQLARWEHITGGRWFIPARNNKSSRDHWIALSVQTQELLNSMPQGRGKIFGMTSETAVQSYLKRWCARNDIGALNQETKHQGSFTPNNLRRTFATRMNELKVGRHIFLKSIKTTERQVLHPFRMSQPSGKNERKTCAVIDSDLPKKTYSDGIDHSVSRCNERPFIET